MPTIPAVEHVWPAACAAPGLPLHALPYPSPPPLRPPHSLRRPQVRHTLLHALPTAQDRVCIVFNNYVATRDSEKAMAAQLTFENKVGAGEGGGDAAQCCRGRSLLLPSSTALLGRRPAATAAHHSWSHHLTALQENVFILPSEQEWDDFKKPVGAV